MSTLQGKIALVTGSTTGIGRGIAEHLASLGARVVVHGRRESHVREVADALRARGADVDAVAGDLVDAGACRSVVRFTVQRYGGIDVLVNNAATTARAYLEDVPVETWDTILNINLRAPLLCMQEAVKSMKTRAGGAIINIGSVNAYIGLAKLGPYSVSKGGLMTLTRNAASAFARYRIRVNQINVGWTLTEGEDRVMRSEGKAADWVEEASRLMPMGRLLTPHEIAVAVAYFASDDAALVNGTVMDLEQAPVGERVDW